MTPPLAVPAPRLVSRDFLILWAVGGIGNGMRWLEALAAALFTLDATGSELAVAVVSAARSLPLIFTGALAGALADALDRRLIVLGGALLAALAAAFVAWLAEARALLPWHLFVASLASGLVYGTDMPARRRMVGESVAASLAPRAIALDSLTSAASRCAGPLLGGVAYQWLGVGGTFALSAALNLIAAALAARLGATAQAPRPISPGALLTDLAEAARVVRRSTALMMLVLVTVAQNLFGFAYTAVIAPAGRATFGVSDALVGVLAAAEPAGATLGGLLLAAFGVPPGRPIALFAGGAAWFMAAMVLTAAIPGFWACSGLLFLGGFGLSVYANQQVTIALTESPEAARSRVMGLVTTAIGGWPLGMLLAGWLAARIGPVPSMSALGACGLLWLAAVSLVPARRR